MTASPCPCQPKRRSVITQPCKDARRHPFLSKTPFRCVDLDILRIMVLVAMLAVPATTDIRTRTVYTDALVMCGAVAASFFAYDVVAGHPRGILWYGSMAAGIIMGIVLSRMGIVGSADGHVMTVASVMLPEYNGMPVAIFGVVAGFIGSFAAIILHNAICNLQDAIKGSQNTAETSIS